MITIRTTTTTQPTIPATANPVLSLPAEIGPVTDIGTPGTNGAPAPATGPGVDVVGGTGVPGGGGGAGGGLEPGESPEGLNVGYGS